MGTLARWDFTEHGSGGLDLSGNGHDLTTHNGDITSPMQFNASNYLVANTLVDVPNQMTVVIHLKVNSTSLGEAWLAFNATDPDMDNRTIMGGWFGGIHSNSWGHKTDVSFSPPPDYFVMAISFDIVGDLLTRRVYADGVFLQEFVTPVDKHDSEVTGKQGMSLGMETDGGVVGNLFNGEMKEVILYDHILTDREIEGLANGINYRGYSREILSSLPSMYLPLSSKIDPSLEISGNNRVTQSNSDFEEHDLSIGATTETGLKTATGSALITIDSFVEAKGDTFTIEFIAKDIDIDTNLVIFERGGDNSNFSLQSIPYHVDGKPSLMLNKGNTGESDTRKFAPDDGSVAHHYVIMVDGANYKAFIDGVQVLEADTLSPQSSTADVRLDVFSRNGGYGTQIILGHLAFYDRLFTEDDFNSRTNYFSGSTINFIPLSVVPDDTVFPADALVSTTAGTGLLNSNGSSVYIKVGNAIKKGESKVIVNEAVTAKMYVSFAEDGLLTISENGNIKTTHLSIDEVGYRVQNGQAIFASSDGDIFLYSELFSYANSFMSVELNNGETIDSVDIENKGSGSMLLLHYYAKAMTNRIWSNKETKAQANPYPPVMQNVKPVEPVVKIMAKFENYNSSINQKGEQRPIGYYQSTVMINKVPTAGKRVFCFNNHGQLMAETISDKSGVYRFDYLLMDTKYMFVAQHSYAPDAPPEYNAVASDWQTPTKYGE